MFAVQHLKYNIWTANCSANPLLAAYLLVTETLLSDGLFLKHAAGSRGLPEFDRGSDRESLLATPILWKIH